mmetsp:Transcript_1436/g.4172  ORF Transcript_1436/g.4172 Transcript_1436/m.4172 type:complete len:477 (-) Transcript_1436:52-1482(-)
MNTKVASIEAAHKADSQAMRDELDRTQLLLSRRLQNTTRRAASTLNATRIQPSREFLSRFRQLRAGSNGFPLFVYCFGKIGVLSGAAILSLQHHADALPLRNVYRDLFRAMKENQDLRQHLREVESKEDVDYASTYGSIALSLDGRSTTTEEFLPSGEGGTNATEAVEAATKELTHHLVKTNAYIAGLRRLGKSKELADAVRSKLRDCVSNKKQAKIFLSLAAKRGSMDYLQRLVPISDVVSAEDLDSARVMYIANSEEPTVEGFDGMTVHSFRTTSLCRAINSTDASVRLSGTRLLISLSKAIRNKSNKAVLPYWQDAGNFNPYSGVVVEQEDEVKGLFLSQDLSVDASSTQKKAQNVATRVFFLQDLDSIITEEYRRHAIHITTFSDILIYSSSTDINKEFGLFERNDFYEKALRKEVQTVADVAKMQHLANKAMERKKAIAEFDQFANVSGSDELEEIFARLLGPLDNVSSTT